MKFGIDIPFLQKPEPFILQNRQFNEKEDVFLQQKIDRLLEQGVISKDNLVKFISPINCVPKKNGTFRLVIDLRKLNSCGNFKYEDINSILEFVSPKDKRVTLDIKDGFYHVPISPNSQQYMGFMYKNEKFKWCKLPSGLCVSPYFFCKILRPIVAFF